VRPFFSFADLPRGSSLVFVNSDPIGVTDDVGAFVTAARAARRARALPFDASIVRAEHGVCISSDMGVVVFPLLYLPRMHALPQALAAAEGGSEELWHAMCRLGIVEYVDAHEMLEYRVAFTPEEVERARGDAVPFQHLAVHPSGFLGTSACSVPWPDHDQAPRVAYQVRRRRRSTGARVGACVPRSPHALPTHPRRLAW
jgi:DNA-directed RNA polymerase beta subunit